MFYSKSSKINIALHLPLVILLASPLQVSAQLSKFNRVYPSQSLGQTGFNNTGFAENNAVSWTKPADVTGVSTISTTRESVSLTIGANRTAGILSGSKFSYPSGGAISQNLTSVSHPIINSSGLLQIPAGSTGFTATQGANWRYNANVKQADVQNTATGIGVLGAGTFSSQEGEASNLDKGFISLSSGNIVANPGQGPGTKVTIQTYSERTSDVNNGTIEYSETGQATSEFQGTQFLNQADSSNNAATFDASTASDNAAREALYVVREDGAGAAIASGGFTNPGANPVGSFGDAIVLQGFIPQPGRKVMNNQAGENAQVMTITSLANPGPGYAEQANVTGGTDADPITFTNTNNIATGNGGTPASTQMTTCTQAAYDCGGVAVGSTLAPYIKVRSDGSFSAFY